MFERFTHEARSAVVVAQSQARELGHSAIGAEHLLLGLLGDADSVAARVLHRLGVDDARLRDQVASFGSPDGEALKSIGIDLEQVRRQAEKTFGPGALDRPRRQRKGLFGHRFDAGGHLPLTTEAKSALALALKEAVGRKDTFIGTEHLLLGVVGTAERSALEVLHRAGATVDATLVADGVREELRRTA